MLPTPLINDLAGFSHVVATRQGLFVINEAEAAILARGSFFGLTIHRNALYAFEHLDHATNPAMGGRILRFPMDPLRTRLDAATLFADDLDNGCHQIAFVGDDLYVLDTYNQRIIVLPPAQDRYCATPLPTCGRGDADYVHLNSILVHGAAIWLMLHNQGTKPSEVIRLDQAQRITERFAIDGYQCHDIAVLDDGDMLFCGSADAVLLSRSGRRVPVIPGLMTRGLAVDGRRIAVGSSLFGPRKVRHTLPGAVTFLDRAYKAIAHVALPGSPTDIQAIHGQ